MPFFKQDDKATGAIKTILLIGLSVLAIRLLIWTDSFHTGLLYIALPFALSLGLYYFTPVTEGTSWKQRFWNNLRTSLIIMFSVSLILMEGYVCLVMFMPIFFVFTLIAFIADYVRHQSDKGSLNVHMIPAMVVLMSIEGVSDQTTFSRYNEVTYSQVIQADIKTLKHRLTNPVQLQGERHWLLKVFPMPEHIGAIELNEGDVRRFDFVYHRWFSTNTHSGSMNVTFDEVTDHRIKTSIKDTSYISGYMTLHGTELTFEPVDEGQTKVTLTVSFDRTLDPVWYFEPLERLAVEKSAKYIVNEMLNKEHI